LVSLIGESSVGSGSRRIEALVGIEAFRALSLERALVARISDSLKTSKDGLEDRIASISEELKTAQRKLAALQAASLATRIPEFIAGAESIGAAKLVSQSLGVVESVDEIRHLVTALRDRVQSEAYVIAVFAEVAGKPSVVIATTSAARESGAKAGAMVREASAVLGGGGGGKDDIAQGGGNDVNQIANAQAAVRKLLGV
jgi:alanyl-tRNA synthetase